MAMEDHEQKAQTPAVSYRPIMVTVGVVMVAAGLITRPLISALGFVITLMSVAAWMEENSRPHGKQRVQVAYEAEHRSTVPQGETNKLGVWWLLAGEVILFSALILGFVVFRLGYSGLYDGFRSRLDVPLVALNTLVLLTSSYMVVRALQAAHRGDSASLVRHLIAVVVLGALFLSGQGYEWATLFREGVRPGDAFGGSFFMVTGVHGMHVFVGITWAAMATIQALYGAYRGDNSLGIEMFGLYWHFVDIVWIILFSLIYLL
jgi:cytochrome c oxidase subunit III